MTSEQFKEEFYSAIKSVLEQFEIPEYYYSIGEPAIECVCLEYKDGRWVVYENIHGENIHVRYFDDAYEAGCSLFGSVALGETKANLMKELKERLKNYQ